MLALIDYHGGFSISSLNYISNKSVKKVSGAVVQWSG